MKLVVDTGRIIAALIKDSTCRNILLSNKCEFLTVNFAESEIAEHKQEIVEKAGITESEFQEVLSLLMSHVKIIGDLVLLSKMNEAEKIMRAIDPADVQFIAAALAVDCEGIWTEDKHFDLQKRIRVFKTASLLKLVKE
jgi:predicted nucleic acid-binding protein